MILMMPENVRSYIVLNQFNEGNDKIGFEEMMTCIDEDMFGGVIPFHGLRHNCHIMENCKHIAMTVRLQMPYNV